MIFICAAAGDTEKDAEKLVSKLTKLRIFTHEEGKMNRSIIDTSGAALAVSQSHWQQIHPEVIGQAFRRPQIRMMGKNYTIMS